MADRANESVTDLDTSALEPSQVIVVEVRRRQPPLCEAVVNGLAIVGAVVVLTLLAELES